MSSNFNISGAVRVGRLAANPTDASNGLIYYNTVANEFRHYVDGAWQKIIDQSVIDALTASMIAYERADGSKKNIQASSDTVEPALTDLDDALGDIAALGTPVNYSTSNEAEVAARLDGIDTALASAGGTDFADDVFRISDNGDSSKKIAFEGSAIATSTTRTITMPNEDVDLGQISTNTSEIADRWDIAGNTLAGAGIIGSLNDQDINFRRNNSSFIKLVNLSAGLAGTVETSEFNSAIAVDTTDVGKYAIINSQTGAQDQHVFGGLFMEAGDFVNFFGNTLQQDNTGAQATFSAGNYYASNNVNLLGAETVLEGSFLSSGGFLGANGSFQSGGVTIKTNDSQTVGTGTANLDSGDITIQTGNATGSGNRGTITFNADADDVLLANQPTGGTALAVATTQYVDSAVSPVSTDVADLVTLSGVAANSTNLGSFTGSVLGNTETVKSALQSLETYAENTRSLIQNFEWQDSALDYITDNTVVPPTEVSGDRYVLSHDGGAPNAAWDGASAGDIVEFDGSSWIATTPTTGTFASVDDESNVLYYWGGSSWSTKAFESTTASTGLTKVGFDIQIADANANGLAISSGVFTVNVDDSTIERAGGAGNPLQLKDGGITNAKINAAAGIDVTKLASGSVDNTEFGYLNGVTSGIQGQIDSKIGSLAEDLTPQLGGALDVNGQDIEDASNDILIAGQDSLKRAKQASKSNFIEEEYIHAIALSASQTDTVIADFTVAHASVEGMEIVYKIKEATSNDIKIGTLRVVTNGTDIVLNEVSTETGDTGIAFTAVINGANINVRYSSGANAATMRADVKKILA